MKINIWSDFACPYCYIGEKRLQKAIDALGMAGKIEIELHAFELDPNAPQTVQSDTLSRFANKYRLPLEQAKAQIEHISKLGREEGIDFRYISTQYTNTFDSHRLMKLAESKSDKKIVESLNWALFDAYFTKNLILSDPKTLTDAGVSAGLDSDEIKKMLNSREYADQVRQDELIAAKRGIHGVPYFLFENGITIPGAASQTDLEKVILSLSKDATPEQKINARQCGPDGCLL